LRPEVCSSPLISPRVAWHLNRRTLAWFNRGPVSALTARNVAARWECGLCGEKCLSHCLRECALQDAGSRHAGGCRKAASTAWMIFAQVPVSPSQRSARFLALPHSGWPTILELTCWVRGTNPSILEQERARSHQIVETKSTETECNSLPQCVHFLCVYSYRGTSAT